MRVTRILPLINRILLLFLTVVVFIDNFINRIHIPYGATVIYFGISLFILLVLIELFLNIKAARPVRDSTCVSFNYLTKRFLFKKFIINTILLVFGVFTVYMPTGGAGLTAFIFVLVGADLLSFVVRLIASHYRIVVDQELITIVEDQEIRIHFTALREVDFRHEVFYFRLKNDQVIDIDLQSIRKERQKEFARVIAGWVERHNIPVVPEGKQKLVQWI